MTYRSRHISVSILAPSDQIYEFTSNPENLPEWASGLSGSIRNIQGEWIAESPMGEVKVKFAEKNKFGILDHDVTLPTGETFYNPMRVFRNQNGSEVVFTLYQTANMTEQEFSEDALMVMKDLEKLKELMEKARG